MTNFVDKFDEKSHDNTNYRCEIWIWAVQCWGVKGGKFHAFRAFFCLVVVASFLRLLFPLSVSAKLSEMSCSGCFRLRARRLGGGWSVGFLSNRPQMISGAHLTSASASGISRHRSTLETLTWRTACFRASNLGRQPSDWKKVDLDGRVFWRTQ